MRLYFVQSTYVRFILSPEYMRNSQAKIWVWARLVKRANAYQCFYVSVIVQ